MKRFVLISIVVMLIILGIYYAVYYDGWLYIPNHSTVTTVAVVDEEEMYLTKENGERTPIEIKGVVLPSSIPGMNDANSVIDSATWIRWFDYIQKMGANTIRIHNIYNVEFYDAFYQYNKNRENPLYLLQGIRVTEYANNSASDAYGEEFYQQLLVEGRTAVDIIHGRKNTSKDNGVYRSDISQWVIGYLVGETWESDVIAYTNANEDHDCVYSGTYFSTGEGATAFETMLAKVMDTMVSYETKKYSTQRLISFVNNPQNDPFEYDTYYGRQIGKYNCLDAERINSNTEVYQGYYASYQLYEYCPEFTKYFSHEQKKELSSTLSRLNKNYFYEGYTQLLAEYHSIPVVICDYGYSTSRGTDGVEGGCSEEIQGEKIVETYNDVVDSGCVGAFISTWQDCWNRLSWNTSYSINLEDIGKWHDVQTIGQNYGIMSFEAGKEQCCCYVDGEIEEWSDSRLVTENEKYTLSVKYDESYMYFMVKGSGVTEENNFYISIDSIKNVGSMTFKSYDLAFDRNVDFVLCIDGVDNTRLLVHERYNSLRQNYLEQITGENPFEDYPEKDSDTFVPIEMIMSNLNIVVLDAEQQESKYSDTYETGKLKCGNANPDSENYDSLADFCYGKECVEFRIPWTLLNVSSPSSMMVHKDYYEHYGREDEITSMIYMGVGDEQYAHVISMAKLPLFGWNYNEVEYHERLKKSYYVIQEEWRE